MKATMNLVLAGAAAMALLAAGAVLDGPSDADLERATAADLADAKATARHEAEILARCRALRGQRAEILHIRGTDDYACRVDGGI